MHILIANQPLKFGALNGALHCSSSLQGWVYSRIMQEGVGWGGGGFQSPVNVPIFVRNPRFIGMKSRWLDPTR